MDKCPNCDAALADLEAARKDGWEKGRTYGQATAEADLEAAESLRAQAARGNVIYGKRITELTTDLEAAREALDKTSRALGWALQFVRPADRKKGAVSEMCAAAGRAWQESLAILYPDEPDHEVYARAIVRARAALGES